MLIVDFKHEIIETKLKTPYNLSYKKLTAYESVITTFTLENGRKLYGEVTPLVGYTDETIQTIESDINEFKTIILGRNINDVVDDLLKVKDVNKSFTLSSILPPLELSLNNEHIKSVELINKDIIYALDCADDSEEEIELKVNNILEQGYDTVKIKVGKDIEKELELIEKLSKIDLKNLKIRFDANCGYSYEDSYIFLDRISSCLSSNVQYLEQPMCKTCWEEMKLLNEQNFQVPIMIDESIYNINDVQKAYDIGSKFVKLKLCKFGSFKKLQEVLDFAKSLELNVIFGNGVATDISNYYEVLFYLNNKDKIFGATEGVGFLKILDKLIYDIKIKEK